MILTNNAYFKWPFSSRSSNNLQISISKTLDILYGDVNEDGEINLQDVIEISKFIAGQIELTDAQKQKADIDQDGVIDTADTQILAEYIVDKM